MWGNQYDLSRPIGSELPEENDPLKNVELLHDHILVDDSENIWSTLEEAVGKSERVTVGESFTVCT